MRYLVLILLSLWTLSCQKNIQGDVTHEYDQYFQDFNSDLVSLGYRPIDFSQTVIRQDNSMTEHDGMCFGVEVKDRGITNISFGKRMRGYVEKQRMLVAYHEIGHCFLGLEHASEARKIMNPVAIQSYSYAELGVESFRLSLVREMLEGSAYGILVFK